MNIWKCEFNIEEIIFLKIIISDNDLCMNLKKVAAVMNWLTPMNLKKTQVFIGFVNFYQWFIKGFFIIIKPLVALIRKEQLFLWNEACKSVFESLKQQMVSVPVLWHFNSGKQAILETDTSDYVTDGVLFQYDNKGVLHPVTFYSKNLIPAECNYHIYDKKLLTIIQCFEH